MLDARTGRTRVTTAALPRATRHGAGAGREPRSTAEPCPLWSTESSVINILPLKTQVKYWRTSPPAGDHPFKLEVTFCVRGVTIPPCGVPSVVSWRTCFSMYPDFNHCWRMAPVHRDVCQKPIMGN